jgi:predicted dehydrogenase/threonine dehydrogenase-like Zn-dependent dehydrogenase
MRAILENVRAGQVASYEVPDPELRPGGVLVRTAFSAISAGTERAHREQVEKSIIGKAMARPDLVRQVINYAKTEGIRSAYQRVQTRLDTLSPLGYSCAGTVLAVAQDVPDFRVGERVACGGAGYGNHSEINFVPKNLVVRVPENVPLDAASLTTIGAIAVQGLRQSQVVFGENVVVIGAGLVGMLTVQIAKAAGCRVIAIDIDRGRVQRALELGAHLGLCSDDSHTPEAVKAFTGHGADVAILTAATRSTDPIELAAHIMRDRGRIVVVGDVGLGVSRNSMYHKELSIALSRSYGPGRYDPQYEEGGIDYPIGYVRWTEQRNMEAFLELLASRAIDVGPLIARRYLVEEGEKAYSELRSSGAYTVLIEYTQAVPKAAVTPMPKAPGEMARKTELRISCIGAGSFARNVIFPCLRNYKGARVWSVATASGIAAESARQSFGFARAQSPDELLRDKETDAIFVISRHDSHARYVVAALSNRTPVFVEKPLAVNRQQLEEICNIHALEKELGHSPFVMVGFNRRFAPLTEALIDFFARRREPMLVHVRVNAGFIASSHWVHHKSDGGRIVGELCHFIDWARFVIKSPIQRVVATALPDGSRYNRDNLAATLSFADGSIANIVYVANGDKSVAKEFFEVFCEGGVARLDDFRSLELVRDSKTRRIKSAHDKGHHKEVQLTLDAIRGGGDAPIPFEELAEVTEATLAITESIVSEQAVRIHAAPAEAFRSTQLANDAVESCQDSAD